MENLVVIIYTSSNCPYCMWANKFFDDNAIEYEEINLHQSPDQMQVMLEKSGNRRTVPQIFVNDYHVGGYDDLMQLKSDGKLQGILEGNTN